MPQTLRLPGGVEDRGTRSLHQRARQQSPEDRKPTDGAVRKRKRRGHCGLRGVKDAKAKGRQASHVQGCVLAEKP